VKNEMVPREINFIMTSTGQKQQPQGLVHSHQEHAHNQVAKITCGVVAQLQEFNLISATQCDAVVRCVTSTYPGKSNEGMVPQDSSCETVHQSIVEGGIVCDLKLADWMASSSSLFIGIDEST